VDVGSRRYKRRGQRSCCPRSGLSVDTHCRQRACTQDGAPCGIHAAALTILLNDAAKQTVAKPIST
jgi:hypothetical protein